MHDERKNPKETIDQDQDHNLVHEDFGGGSGTGSATAPIKTNWKLILLVITVIAALAAVAIIS